LDADASRMTQVLSNLLTNAAKYTPKGGRIDLRAEQEAETVVVRIRDTGVGIPAAMLTRIFDLFVQVNPSTDVTRGGLGIGLALVRQLVELHGGSVHAFSDGPGRGSEFVVRLPVLSRADSSPEEPEKRQRPGGEGSARRILIVDDNAEV